MGFYKSILDMPAGYYGISMEHKEKIRKICESSEILNYDFGVLYLHDYYPKRMFNEIEPDKIALTKQIWDYKNCVGHLIGHYTKLLELAIRDICRFVDNDKIGLITVPSSTAGKTTAISISIDSICDSLKIPGVKIYNYGDLLYRNKSIEKSHYGNRASIDEQLDSLSCRSSDLSKYKTTFILIDDVITSGTTSDACRITLEQHGANLNDLYTLVIGRTVI